MARLVLVSEPARQRLTPWYAMPLLEGTPILKGSFSGWLFGRLGQAAVTLNKKVHLTRYAPDLESTAGVVLLGHELYHVLQQQRMGWWRFLASYAWRWRPAHITQGWKHPLEIPAYEREAEIRSNLEGPPIN